MKKVLFARLALVAAPVLFVASQAHAAMDTTAATAGISDATTGLLVVIGGMTTMAIAIWGARKLSKFFGGGK